MLTLENTNYGYRCRVCIKKKTTSNNNNKNCFMCKMREAHNQQTRSKQNKNHSLFPIILCNE